jgi:hypothetical protein
MAELPDKMVLTTNQYGTVARKPRTGVRLTAARRKAFLANLNSIAKVIEDRQSH